MSSENKALKIINYLVVFFLLCTLALAVSFFVQQEPGLGATFSGMLVVFGFLYWKYGLTYFEVRDPEADNF